MDDLLTCGPVTGRGALGTSFVGWRRKRDTARPPAARAELDQSLESVEADHGETAASDSVKVWVKTTPATVAEAGPLRQKVRTLARRARAPCLVRYEGVHVHTTPRRDADEVWIVSEYVEGAASLRDILLAFRENGKLELDERVAVHVVHQVVKAVEWLHARGFSHGMLHSGNVLLARDGSVKLSDYGLWTEIQDLFHHAKHLAALRVGSTSHVGSSRDSLASDDVFATGCLVLEMVSGKPVESFALDETTRKMPSSLRLQDFVFHCLRRRNGQTVEVYELLEHNVFCGMDELPVPTAWFARAVAFAEERKARTERPFEPSDKLERFARSATTIEVPFFELSSLSVDHFVATHGAQSHEQRPESEAATDRFFHETLAETIAELFPGSEESVRLISSATVVHPGPPHTKTR